MLTKEPIPSREERLITRIKDLLGSVKYLDYIFKVTTSPRGETYIQADYLDNDIYTKKLVWQQTRRWLISPLMTDSEIVSTAFKLCLTSAEHRCREAFQYKQARIYGPHFDVEDLVSLCRSGGEDAGGRKSTHTV